MREKDEYLVRPFGILASSHGRASAKVRGVQAKRLNPGRDMREAATVRSVAASAQDLGHAVADFHQGDKRLIIHPLCTIPDGLHAAEMAHVQPQLISAPQDLRYAAVSPEAKPNR
jgi:hypothetical protein